MVRNFQRPVDVRLEPRESLILGVSKYGLVVPVAPSQVRGTRRHAAVGNKLGWTEEAEGAGGLEEFLRYIPRVH